MGSLLKHILVTLFHAPVGRYVDDFFGVDAVECKLTGGICFTELCRLVGVDTDPARDSDNEVNVAVLDTQVEVDL